MANRITTLFDFKETGGGLKKIKADIAGVDGAWGKARVGFKSAVAEFKQSGAAQAAVGAAMIQIGHQAVQAASDLAESANAVDKTFGAAADGIHKLGENAAQAYGLSESAFNSMSVQMSAFAKQVTPAGESVVETVDEMMTRASDFASVMNVDVAEAANIFQQTLAGSSEVARKYGLDVSAATVEQYLLAEGIASSKSEITEAMKVQGRYALLLEGTSHMAGDFADTSDSLANAQRRLAAQTENLSARLGEEIIPQLELMVNTATKGADAIDELSDALDRVPTVGGPLGVVTRNLGRNGPVVGAFGVLKDTLGQVRDAVDGVSEGMTRYGKGLEARANAYDLHNRQQARATKATAIEAEAARDAAKAQNFLATQTTNKARADKDAADAAEEHANQIDALYSSTVRLVGGDIAVRDAQRQADEAMRNLSASAAAQSEEVDDATRAQLDLATTTADAKIAQMEAGGELLTSKEKAEILRAELQKLADKLDGPVRDALLGYIGDLDRIPRQVDTWVNTNYRDVYHSEMSRDEARARNAGSVNTLPARAAGGPVQAGRTYLVGEQGPELITPGAGGTVIPNDKLGGVGSPSVTINVTAGLGTDGVQVGRQVAEALERYYRSGGRRI